MVALSRISGVSLAFWPMSRNEWRTQSMKSGWGHRACSPKIFKKTKRIQVLWGICRKTFAFLRKGAGISGLLPVWAQM